MENYARVVIYRLRYVRAEYYVEYNYDEKLCVAIILGADLSIMTAIFALSILYTVAVLVQGFEVLPLITFSQEKIIALRGENVTVTANITSEKAFSQVDWEFSSSSNLQQLHLMLICNTNQSKSIASGHHSSFVVASLQTLNCKTGNTSLRIFSVPSNFKGIMTLKLTFTENATSTFSAEIPMEIRNEKLKIKRQSDYDTLPSPEDEPGLSSSIIAAIILFAFAACLIMFYCYVYCQIEKGQKFQKIRSGEIPCEDEEGVEEEEEEEEEQEEGQQKGYVPKSRLNVDDIPDRAVSSTSNVSSQQEFESRQYLPDSTTAVSQRDRGRTGQKAGRRKDKDKSYVTLLFEGKPALRVQQDKKRSIVFNINKAKSTAVDALHRGTSFDDRKSKLKVQKIKKPQTAYKFREEKSVKPKAPKSPAYHKPKKLRSVAQQSSFFDEPKPPKELRSVAQQSSFFDEPKPSVTEIPKRYLDPKGLVRQESSNVDSPVSSRSLGQYLVFNIFQRGSSISHRPKDPIEMTVGDSSFSGHRAEVRKSSRLVDSALGLFRPSSKPTSRRQKENPKHKRLFSSKKK